MAILCDYFYFNYFVCPNDLSFMSKTGGITHSKYTPPPDF